MNKLLKNYCVWVATFALFFVLFNINSICQAANASVQLTKEKEFQKPYICETSGDHNCWYVAPDGDDSNDGGFYNPFATIQHSVNQMQAGDILYLRGGTFHELGISLTSNKKFLDGREDAWYTIKSYPGEWAIIDGQHDLANNKFKESVNHPHNELNIFRGTSRNGAMGYIKFESMELTGAGFDINHPEYPSHNGSAIVLRGGPFIFRNLYIHDNYGKDNINQAGLTLRNGTCNTIIEYCYFKANGQVADDPAEPGRRGHSNANLVIFADYAYDKLVTLYNPETGYCTSTFGNEIRYNLFEANAGNGNFTNAGFKHKGMQRLTGFTDADQENPEDLYPNDDSLKDKGDKIHHNIFLNHTVGVLIDQDYAQVHNNILFMKDWEKSGGGNAIQGRDGHCTRRGPFNMTVYNNTINADGLRGIILHPVPQKWSGDIPYIKEHIYNNIVENALDGYDYAPISIESDGIDATGGYPIENLLTSRNLIYKPMSENLIYIHTTKYTEEAIETTESADNVYQSDVSGLYQGTSGATQYKTDGSFILDLYNTVADGGIGGEHPYLEGITLPNYVGAVNPNGTDSGLYWDADNPDPDDAGWVDYVLNLKNLNHIPVCEASEGYNCWYVSPTGSNDNDGSFKYPFKDLQYAIDHMQGGDIIYLREGTYQEGHIRIDLDKNGTCSDTDCTDGSWSTIKSYPGEWAVLDGQNGEGDGGLNGKVVGADSKSESVIGYIDSDKSGAHDLKYWSFEGIEIKNGASADGSHATGFGGNGGPFHFKNCYVHDNLASSSDGNPGGLRGDIWHDSIIEYCYFANNGCNISGRHNCADINLFTDYNWENIAQNGFAQDDDTAVRRNTIRYNLFSNSPVAIKYKGAQFFTGRTETSPYSDTFKEYGDKIHNNIFLNTIDKAVVARQDFIQIYNNIFDSCFTGVSVGEGDNHSIYKATVYNNTVMSSPDKAFWREHKWNWDNQETEYYGWDYNNIIDNGKDSWTNDDLSIDTVNDFGGYTPDYSNYVGDRNYFYRPDKNYFRDLEGKYIVWIDNTRYTESSYEDFYPGTNLFRSFVKSDDYLYQSTIGPDKYKTNATHVIEDDLTAADAGINISHPYLPGIKIPGYIGAVNPNGTDSGLDWDADNPDPNDAGWVDYVFNLGFRYKSINQELMITSQTENEYVHDTATISFLNKDFDSPECSLDNRNWTACTSDITTFDELPGWDNIDTEESFTLYVRDGESTTEITLNKLYCEAPLGYQCWYVSPTGNNDNEGTFDMPFQDLQYALDTMAGGDIIYLMSGVYQEGHIRIDSTKDGTCSDPDCTIGSWSTIKSYPGEWAVLDGQNGGGDGGLNGKKVGDDSQSGTVLGIAISDVAGHRALNYWKLERIEIKNGATPHKEYPGEYTHAAGFYGNGGPFWIRHCYIHDNMTTAGTDDTGHVAGSSNPGGLKGLVWMNSTVEFCYFKNNGTVLDPTNDDTISRTRSHNCAHINIFSDYKWTDIATNGYHNDGHSNMRNTYRYNLFEGKVPVSIKHKAHQLFTKRYGQENDAYKTYGDNIHHNIMLDNITVALSMNQDFVQVHHNIIVPNHNTVGDTSRVIVFGENDNVGIYKGLAYNNTFVSKEAEFGLNRYHRFADGTINYYGYDYNNIFDNIFDSWNSSEITVGNLNFSANGQIPNYDNYISDRNYCYRPGISNINDPTGIYIMNLDRQRLTESDYESMFPGVDLFQNDYNPDDKLYKSEAGADQFKTIANHVVENDLTIGNAGINSPHPYLPEIRIPDYIGAVNPNGTDSGLAWDADNPDPDDAGWVDYVLNLKYLNYIPICEASEGDNCWYVSPTGSNDNDGSFKDPFKDLQFAIDHMQGGDIVYLREGTYQEGHIRINPDKNGTCTDPDCADGSWSTIKSYPGEWAVLDGQNGKGNGGLNEKVVGADSRSRCVIGYVGVDLKYWRFEGIEIKNGASADSANAIGFSGNGGPFHFSNCYIHDNLANSGNRYPGGLHGDVWHDSIIEYCFFENNGCDFSDRRCADINIYAGKNSKNIAYNGFSDEDAAIHHNTIRYNLFKNSPVAIQYNWTQYLTGRTESSPYNDTFKEYGDKIHHNIFINSLHTAVLANQDFVQIYNNIFDSCHSGVNSNYTFYKSMVYNNTVMSSPNKSLYRAHKWAWDHQKTEYFGWDYNNIVDNGTDNWSNDDLSVDTYNNFGGYTPNYDNYVGDRNYFYRPDTTYYRDLDGKYIVWIDDTRHTESSYEALYPGTHLFRSDVNSDDYLYQSTIGPDKYKVNANHMIEDHLTIADAGINTAHPYLSGITIPAYIGAVNPDGTDSGLDWEPNNPDPDDAGWVDYVLNFEFRYKSINQDLVITSQIEDEYVHDTATIDFLNNDFQAPECSLDNTNWTACTPGLTTFDELTGWDHIKTEESLTLYLRDGESSTSLDLKKLYCEAPVGYKCWYVSPKGSNDNEGTFDMPFQDLQYALDTMAGGDIIYLMSGVYQEGHIRIDHKKDGTCSDKNCTIGSWSTIKSYPGNWAVLDGQNGGGDGGLNGKKVGDDTNSTAVLGMPTWDVSGKNNLNYWKLERIEIKNGASPHKHYPDEYDHAAGFYANGGPFWIKHCYIHDNCTSRNRSSGGLKGQVWKDSIVEFCYFKNNGTIADTRSHGCAHINIFSDSRSTDIATNGYHNSGHSIMRNIYRYNLFEGKVPISIRQSGSQLFTKRYGQENDTYKTYGDEIHHNIMLDNTVYAMNMGQDFVQVHHNIVVPYQNDGQACVMILNEFDSFGLYKAVVYNNTFISKDGDSGLYRAHNYVHETVNYYGYDFNNIFDNLNDKWNTSDLTVGNFNFASKGQIPNYDNYISDRNYFYRPGTRYYKDSAGTYVMNLDRTRYTEIEFEVMYPGVNLFRNDYLPENELYQGKTGAGQFKTIANHVVEDDLTIGNAGINIFHPYLSEITIPEYIGAVNPNGTDSGLEWDADNPDPNDAGWVDYVLNLRCFRNRD